MLSKEDFRKALEEAINSAKKRRFVQSVELLMKLKDIDMRRPENRIRAEVELPKGRGKEVKIAFIGDGILAEKAAELLGKENVYTKEQIEKLAKEKKRNLKKLAKRYYWFLIKADLLRVLAPLIAPVFGPRNKIPKPVATPEQLESMVERLRKTVRVDSKRNPVLMLPIGTETMNLDDLAENAAAAYSQLVALLPHKEQNVEHVYVKLTMGPAVRVK
ncbi:MAG: 50S ribosomal protein L1 [bacterium]|nr:50S ribosomal protein L1 [bacterium]